ncbi:DUF1592 domain-containing protein [Sorangium sp. So ce269]
MGAGVAPVVILWNTTPDDALLDAAELGALDTAEGVREQAERLLSQKRARVAARRSSAYWLELDGTPTTDAYVNGPLAAR